jgi:type IV secretory pathway VirB4 component
MSLVAQMRTKIIFPGADYSDAELRKLQLSAAAIRMLKTNMTIGKGRRFLLWRSGSPAICEFDLSSLPQLPLLAGREKTINLMERVRAEHKDPAEALAEFTRRLDNIKRAA